MNGRLAYWTDAEKEILDRVTSFNEMVPVGLQVLRRMQTADSRPIIQVCGPMSTGGLGSLQANMAYFEKTLDVAVSKGLHVFNQMPFEAAMKRLAAEHDARGEYCQDILQIFYRGVFTSGLIKKLLFLPTWRTSVGARWEYDEGLKIGIPIEDFPDEWLALIQA